MSAFLILYLCEERVSRSNKICQSISISGDYQKNFFELVKEKLKKSFFRNAPTAAAAAAHHVTQTNRWTE